MSAVAFFYAGSLQVQWQTLIVVIFLFFGTLAFFAVLFDETDSEFTRPLLPPTTVQEGEVDEEVGYQTHPSTDA